MHPQRGVFHPKSDKPVLSFGEKVLRAARIKKDYNAGLISRPIAYEKLFKLGFSGSICSFILNSVAFNKDLFLTSQQQQQPA